MTIRPYSNLLNHNSVFQLDYVALCKECRDVISNMYRNQLLVVHDVKYKTLKSKLTLSGRLKFVRGEHDLNKLKNELGSKLVAMHMNEFPSCTIECKLRENKVVYFTLEFVYLP